MKRILYLTFYYEPDLCAGSFRNTPLIKELALHTRDFAEIDVLTTFPNRYNSFNVEAEKHEKERNLTIYRIPLPPHKSGMKDQARSFKEYYFKTLGIIKNKKYDLVIASSSRLFTAFLGYRIASGIKVPLYIDIRDIFYDTMEDVLDNKLIKAAVLPIIKQVEKKTFNYATHINLISEGFKSYFQKYEKPHYSFYTNGIDEMFLENNASLGIEYSKSKKIVYAGNLGEGQGLDKIIPEAAKLLGDEFNFVIIGDGGTKERLLSKIKSANLSNVTLVDPLKREELIKVYESCDYTFVHLNDYEAFKKVLPSKIFELACFPQPMIAGVSGYANRFIAENIDNRILFKPCDAEDLALQLKNFTYKKHRRIEFLKKFNRSSINKEMVESMLKYL